MNAVSFKQAMANMEKIRIKSLQASHHQEFLSKCLQLGRIPRGLRLQNTKVHLMNTPTAAKTREMLAKTYALAESGVCKALIEHYTTVQRECEEAREKIDKEIREILCQGEPAPEAVEN